MAMVFDAHRELHGYGASYWNEDSYVYMSDYAKCDALRGLIQGMAFSIADCDYLPLLRQTEHRSYWVRNLDTRQYADMMRQDISYVTRARRRIELYSLLHDAIYYRNGQCNCEHSLHDGNPRLGSGCRNPLDAIRNREAVTAEGPSAYSPSPWRAVFVGAICQHCANNCMADYAYRYSSSSDDKAVLHSECCDALVRIFKDNYRSYECDQCGYPVDDDGKRDGSHYRRSVPRVIVPVRPDDAPTDTLDTVTDLLDSNPWEAQA